MLDWLRQAGPAERRYLGLVSGETGEKIKRLPLVGTRLESYLARKAQRAQDTKQKLPGTFTALVMHLLSWWRVAQLRRVMRLARRGVVVVVDRYPQAEIPGFHFDGPGFTATASQNWLLRRLVARERRLYEWMAAHRPALVIRLNIDPETAHARKPDHRITELREKSSVMPRLRFNGAKVCDLDARAAYAQVLAAAVQAVQSTIGVVGG